MLKWMEKDGKWTCTGSGMGRCNTVPETTGNLKLHLERMKMTDRDYDTGGAYWGCGSEATGFMWIAWQEDPEVRVFIRARTRKEAKKEVISELEGNNVTFYR